MDRFEAMQLFVDTVQTGSFSETARRRHMSKASVSKYISGLEDQLKVRLLNRTTRKISLTDEGRILFEHSQRILQDVDEVEEIIATNKTSPKGLLRVTAPLTFGQLHLQPILADFLKTYPEILMDLSLSDQRVDMIEEGFDMAIRIGDLPDSSLIAKKLAPARMVVVASPEYLKQHGEPKTPEDLKDHDCITYSYGSLKNHWKFYDKGGKERSVEVQSRAWLNNGAMIQHMVCEGLGIALLPTFIVGSWLQCGSLQVILSDYKLPEMNIYAVYPERRYLSNRVRLMIEYLEGKFGAKPYWDLVE